MTLVYSDPGSVGITTGDRGEVENGGQHSSVLTGQMKTGTCSSEFLASVGTLGVSSLAALPLTKETDFSAQEENRSSSFSTVSGSLVTSTVQ